jgi:hypothetical protein
MSKDLGDVINCAKFRFDRSGLLGFTGLEICMLPLKMPMALNTPPNATALVRDHYVCIAL